MLLRSPLIAYRRGKSGAIFGLIHAWANDRFLGKEFKFATDRRLTAFVLGARMGKNNNELWKIKIQSQVFKYTVTEPDTTFQTHKATNSLEEKFHKKYFCYR